VIVGHSERREYHGETDEIVNSKVRAAIRNGIAPILCVGEGLSVRESGEHTGHCTSQLTNALAKVTAEQARDLVVAYEPVWAIGTGRVASPADAQEVCAALRAALAARYGDEFAAGVRILYGGSVKANNVADLMAGPDVDGALVGGASIDVDEFPKLCALAAGGPLP
jgi:triosephosphate isomerase (TIM)